MDFTYDELDRAGFKYSAKCQICAARHAKTKVAIRDEIERMFYETGGSYLDVLRHYQRLGYPFTLSLIRNHVSKHAPYLLNIGKTKKIAELAKQSVEEHADAEKALNRIISMGDKMVESGDMPITEKLYLGALNLKSKQQENNSMRNFLSEVFNRAYQKKLSEDDKPEEIDGGQIDVEKIKDVQEAEIEEVVEKPKVEEDEIISGE